ncbi:PREDICTED: ankyrin repeat domain-containing protein 11-like [Acropora digitifera]|uniref:ankyrin repeat domain-containing protein 11-like n=1 Tax=Acropora digitifera TaxID=70779 RepID=UPI00077A36E4|nr:PREDICTED: ankyrin repeat domain-containing protein 11-like [Acropora digitifera]
MATQRAHLLLDGKSICRASNAPTTPNNTRLVEEVKWPLHITPLESIELHQTPSTPLKDPLLKKKSGKPLSKRKLFLQSGKHLQINKAKKHCGPRTAATHSQVSKSTETGSMVSYPLTERQQLQYLLEVTAKEAKQDTGSSSNEDLPSIINKSKNKDTGKDNQLETRIRKRNERGETALHVAAIKGDLEDVIALIKAGAAVDVKDNAGWTPLHEACNYGNLRIVQELVWSGANVNSLGYKAITPLHDAVINDHAKVVKFLLENGADPNLRTSQNYSTAKLARSETVFRLVCPEQTLMENNYYYSPISSHESRVQFNEVNTDFPAVMEVDVSSTESESFYNGNFEPRNDLKSPVLPSIQYECSQDKTCSYPLESLQVSSVKHPYKQDFQDNVEFSKTVVHCSDETEFSGIREKKDFCDSFPSSSASEKIYRTGVYQQSSNSDIDCTEVECDVTNEVVNRSNVTESSSENPIENSMKEAEAQLPLGCPDSLEESIATETLVRMYARKNFAAKLGAVVSSESEEDTVAPERLNECLDKAMIEISTYLGANHSFITGGPPRECDNMSKGGFGVSKRNIVASRAKDWAFSLNQTSQECQSASDLRPKNHLPSFVENHKTDQKASESNVLVGSPTRAVTGSGDSFQSPENFTKIRTRSEKKKELNGVERSSTTGRRKKTSAKSSDCSKHGIGPTLAGEECIYHLRDVTWREKLLKFKYKLSDVSPHVPGFEDFVINGSCRSRALFHMDEQRKESTDACQLDKTITRHESEKVKLRMTLEQEIVRLFGDYARKAAGYRVPFSACSVIMSQMGSLERGIKRDSIEGEHLPSLKLEVEKILNKFNRLKAEMLKRHNREIEVIIALEKFEMKNDELTGEGRMSLFKCGIMSSSGYIAIHWANTTKT